MIILAFLLIMRVGWKVFAACLAAFAVPLAAYALIFFSEHGQLNITDSTGLFLWSRTMSFANCAVIKPPPSLVPLCPENQPGHPTSPAPAWSVPALLNERTPADYLWDAGAWYRVDAHPGVNAYNNKLAMQFAERAIARAAAGLPQDRGQGGAGDLLRHRPADRTTWPCSSPWRRTSTRWPRTCGTGRTGTRTPTPTRTWSSRGRTSCSCTRSPSGSPGAVFFLVMAGGLVLLIRRWRGWGRYAALAWGVAIVNLVLPIAAHELDYRYAISAVPFACLALGLTCIRKPAPGLPRRCAWGAAAQPCPGTSRRGRGRG